MPRGTPASRLAARLDTTVTLVKEDGSTRAAQSIAIDKQGNAVAASAAGAASIAATTSLRCVGEATLAVARGDTFGLVDATTGLRVEYRVVAVHPVARGISKTFTADMIDS